MFTLLTAVVLSVAVPQVHPCDAVLPVNPSVVSPVVAGFCSQDPALASVRVFFDSTSAAVWVGAPARLTGVNSQGDYYYETPPLPVLKGAHVAFVDISNGTQPLSTGYAFTVVSKGQANKVRIKGGE